MSTSRPASASPRASTSRRWVAASTIRAGSASWTQTSWSKQSSSVSQAPMRPVPEALRARTSGEWLEEFDRRDVPAMPYNTLGSLMEDPHLRAVGLVQAEIRHAQKHLARWAAPQRRRTHWPPPISASPKKMAARTRAGSSFTIPVSWCVVAVWGARHAGS